MKNPGTTKRDRSKETLTTLLEEWQRRLRLQDWDITADWANHYDCRAFGRCNSSLPNKNATIQIVPPEQIEHGSIVDDSEVTLVHELLHVKAAEVVETGADVKLQDIDKVAQWECFIDQVAQALVAAKRGTERVRFEEGR